MLCVCIMGIQPSKNIRDRSKTHQMASFSASPFFFLSQNSFRPDVSQKYRPDVSTKTKHLPPVHSHPSEEREGMWLGDTHQKSVVVVPVCILVLSCGWLMCLVLWGDHAFQFVDVIVPVVSIFVLHRPHVLPVCLVCVHTFHHAFVPSSVEPLRHCASDV